MPEIEFKVDELENEVLAVVTSEDKKDIINRKVYRLDYFAFLEMIYKKNMSDNKKLELQKLKDSEKNAQNMVLNMLYGEEHLALKKPLNNVIAISDYREFNEKEYDYIIEIEVTSAFDYSFTKVYSQKLDSINYSSVDAPRIRVDYGSKYILHLPVKKDNVIVGNDIKVYRQTFAGENEFIPYLSDKYSYVLDKKTLEYIIPIREFNNIFMSFSKEEFRKNPLLKERVLSVRNKSEIMNWEGVVFSGFA